MHCAVDGSFSVARSVKDAAVWFVLVEFVWGSNNVPQVIQTYSAWLVDEIRLSWSSLLASSVGLTSPAAPIARREIERAVSRGVRFVEGVYKTKDMEAVGPWTVRDGKFTDEWGLDTTSYNFIRKQIPICQANMEVLSPCTENGIPVGLSGQDKYLGGMASPCGRYIYGVPGHAKRVIQVDVNTRKVEMIGPEYQGEFKWLRGVEIPADDMGKNEDGSYAYPSGCCLALPCNSEEGCVLKVDPATASVTTFITDPIPNGAETGWLYHGGSLAGGCVYAIPASASRVMKIGE